MDPDTTDSGPLTGNSSAVRSTSLNRNTADATFAPIQSFALNQPVQRPADVKAPRHPGFQLSWEHETPETMARAIAAEYDDSTSSVAVARNSTPKKLKSSSDKASMRASTKGPLCDAPDPDLQAPEMDLLLSDILCFFPRYYLRPGVMERMIKAKLTSPDIAKYINFCRTTQVKHQMIYNGSMLPVMNNKDLHDTSLLTPTTNFRVASDDLTKQALRRLKAGQGKDEKQPGESPSFSVSVIQLGQGVFRWPKGCFLTPLVEAVKYCVIANDISWTLESLPKLVDELKAPMPQLRQGEHYDVVFAGWVKKHLQKGHSCPECKGEDWEEDRIRKLDQSTELEEVDEHSLDNGEEDCENYGYANGLDKHWQDEGQSDYPPLPFPHDDPQPGSSQASHGGHRGSIQNHQISRREEIVGEKKNQEMMPEDPSTSHDLLDIEYQRLAQLPHAEWYDQVRAWDEQVTKEQQETVQKH